MDANAYVVLRVLHILVAASWVGAAGLLAVVVMPAVGDAGAAGGPFLASLHRRKLHVFMAASALLTVLSGIWLYWVLTTGFDPAIVWSRGGVAFGIGGLCGLVALIVGGGIIGPGFARLAELAEQTDAMPESQRAAHLQRLEAIHRRTLLASKCALALMLIALVLMASGHYV
ncbi:MAG TPA: hypothetical protein VJL61_12800 [Rhodanobacteraceae bacterium]|nr:hypothetical protein [Rhodanobacteraceae bacterium]